MQETHATERHPSSGQPPWTARGGAVAAEREQERPSFGPPNLALAVHGYSIRLAQPTRGMICPICGRHFLAAGPTGFLDDEPICDFCLLERVEELGMVLALISVGRLFAVSRYRSREEYDAALAEFGAFARIYERVASRSGPPRIFRR